MILIHNPRCSKSRAAKGILEERKVNFETRLYLQDKLSKKELRDILKKLGMNAEGLLRKKEQAYVDFVSENMEISEDKILDLMIREPKVIERPIFISGDYAVIGRPPENILEII